MTIRPETIAKLKALLVGVLAFASLSCASPRIVDMVLLGGQSNMEGSGRFDELDDATKRRIELASERVKVSQDGRIPRGLSSKGWFRPDNNFGPELFLGLTLAEKYPDRDFLLIKTAIGGTTLSGAWSPDWSAQRSSLVEMGDKQKKMKLYSQHLRGIKKRISRLEMGRRDYRMMGMAWMQGESDTLVESAAHSYEENLTNLIRSYREDLDQPNLPFVFAQVNNPIWVRQDFDDGLVIVREGMARVSKRVPNTTMIPTSMNSPWLDFPKHEDEVHYNTEGLKRLGVAFANALIELN